MPTKWIVNATKAGNPTVDNNGVVSDFGDSSYMILSSTFTPGSSTWVYIVKFTTGSSVSTAQGLAGAYGTSDGCTPFYINNGNLVCWLSSNGSSWDIANGSVIMALAANTTYKVKAEFTGSAYKFYSYENDDWDLKLTITSSSKVHGGLYPIFGNNRGSNNPFLGSIDFKECSISVAGELFWEGAYAKDVSGSVTISKGFYNDGTYQIMLPDTNIYLSDLVLGQTYGCLNGLYVTSYNGTATVRASNANAPTGVYDTYIGLETPVYLSHSKNYIIGESLKEADWSFENDTYGPTNYSVVGSPTISSDYILSDISNTKYVTMTIPSLSSSFVCIAKHILPASVSSSGSYPCSISVTSGNDGWGVGPGGAAFGPNMYLESAATSYASGSFLNTKVWTYLKITTSNTRAYYLEDATDKYTLDTLPDIESGEWTLYAGYNSNMLSKVSNKTLAIGVNYYQSRSYANWTFDLTGVRIICDGVVKTAKQHTLASLSATPVVAYNRSIDDSYWVPTNTHVLLNALKDSYTLSDRSGIYYYNNTGVDQDVSGIAVTSDPQTDLASCASYYDSDKSVYLNHTSNATILGIGKYPDQVALTASSTSFTPNYSVTGSPSITSNFIASGFSSSNYLVGPSFDSNQNFEIVTKVSESVASTSYCQIIGTSATSSYGIYIGIDDSNRFHLNIGNGSTSWAGGVSDSSTVALNTDYWLKCSRNGNVVNLYKSTDNSTWSTIATITTSYSNTGTLGIGAYASSGTDAFTNGTVDLKETYISVNGTEVWRATEPGPLDTIAADSEHYWTNLMNTTIDVQGVSAVTASNWEGSTGSTGYVLCANGSLSLTKLNSFTDTGDKAYTGYTATFTDSTGAVVSSLTKTGTLCRCFRRNNGAGFGWVFIPEENIPEEEDTHVYTEGEANEVTLLEASSIPVKGQPSTQQYTYSRSAGGVTDESDNFYADIGYIYVEWRSA